VADFFTGRTVTTNANVPASGPGVGIRDVVELESVGGEKGEGKKEGQMKKRQGRTRKGSATAEKASAPIIEGTILEDPMRLTRWKTR
jgi:hypothetical protein